MTSDLKEYGEDRGYDMLRTKPRLVDHMWSVYYKNRSPLPIGVRFDTEKLLWVPMVYDDMWVEVTSWPGIGRCTKPWRAMRIAFNAAQSSLYVNYNRR